jgi:hypothetical protein
MYGVNLGCLEEVSDEELSRVPITYVDGRNDRFGAPESSFTSETGWFCEAVGVVGLMIPA